MRAQNALLQQSLTCVGRIWLSLVLLGLENVGAAEVQKLSNLADFPKVASQNPTNGFHIDLHGTILWSDRHAGKLIVQDQTGAEELELNLRGQRLSPGDVVQISGDAPVARSGAAFRISAPGPVVDNNGVHGVIEKSGAAYLRAGFQPIAVEWFNGVEKSGLEVAVTGPAVQLEKIPDSALFHWQIDAAAGTSNLVNGLDFQSYEGAWEALPDFDRMTAVKAGTLTNFDVSAASRREHVGVRFSGFLKIAQEGLYVFSLRSDDGSRLFVGEPGVAVTVIGRTNLPATRKIIPGQILQNERDHEWAEAEGNVSFVSGANHGLTLELRSGAGRMRVEVTDASGLSAGPLVNCSVRAVGVCQSTLTSDGQRMAGALFVANAKQLRVLQRPWNGGDVESAGTNSGLLPLLTAAVEVHRLKRDQAQRGYPVRIRGVITAVLPEHQAFTIQDSTRGLYVEDPSASRPTPPKPGEFIEVEGTTDPKDFAPIVKARRVSSLAAGGFPDPVRPTWDQLVNGSMDAQYVELQGIVTDVQTNRITMRTEGGVVEVELRLATAENGDLRRYENALVRLRGCLLASWDYVTHQVSPGDVKVYNATISVDQPAPEDLFSTPPKNIPELRLFDPQASVFQRVKVTGQLVYLRDNESFLMQNGHGLRVVAKAPLSFESGDLVEVVGFPDLFGRASPVLREARLRKTGQATLPEARKLSPNDLLRADADATLVRVEGVLVNVRKAQEDYIFELQSGVRSFIGRLAAAKEFTRSLALGSRLELTGVYLAQTGNPTGGVDVGSFELLLNDADGIRVLARPPWWTLEKLLAMIGALAAGLAVTVLWITQLRRKVEERTAELGRQIQERQRVEHQREMEEERSRIAQDLHDELGSGITEIGMLAARAKSASAQEDRRSDYLEQMRGKAREMVTALDEIVWAMNPRHDSLGSLVSYFNLYADRFLSLASIAWRSENSSGPAEQTVSSRHRHQLFLAFKEALTNVVRHSGATEVRVAVQFENGELRLTIADNGCGLPVEARTDQMDGVMNMRERIERLDGKFEIGRGAAGGTIIRFVVPLK